ncbi:MAG: cellulase family glycosylhydrolase [Spirochaetales bacterium]|nr:cellulase family glycosylhydrolase [Spirochaetales bacterium]
MFYVLIVLFLTGTLVASYGQQWRVDDSGNITLNGQAFKIKGGSWFGLEGRHEPSDDANNPSGAPMEQYIGNVWWAESGRTYEQDVQEIKQMGINTVRLPLVHQTLDANDPQGRAPYLKNAPSVVIANSRLAVETIVQLLDEQDIKVILDIHSCNNYVGWRAGRIDDAPPWTDADRDNYDFTRESYSCDYTVSQWQADLRDLAGLGQSIGCDNVMAIEIFNEPWDYTWAEWRSLIDQAYSTINSVNSNILIMAGGISNKAQNLTIEVPHGDETTNPNWGENLFEAGDNPPTMPKNRLVYVPHTYGPSVFVQMQFMDPSQPECEGKEGDEAGDLRCNIVINPTLLNQGWEEHFGYLKDLGYALSINEWGGNPKWPDGAEERMQDRWGWLPDKTVDWQWQEALVDYLIAEGICDSCYWSINPESGDTGGLYLHAYDPNNNTGGWGTWNGQDSQKMGLLNRYWRDCVNGGTGGTAAPTATPATTTVPTATPSTTTAPTATPSTTTAPTATPSTTQIPGNCNVSFNPANSTQGVNSTFDIGIVVNSGSQNVAAYGFEILYNASVLDAIDANEGAQGYLAASNLTGSGVASVTGFDASGTGPGSSVELVVITFRAIGEGDSTLTLNVDQLVDSDTNTVGSACGNAGSVTVSDVATGDTNGDGVIDIIDALLTAQYYVNLNPADFNPAAADTNCDGTVDIIDALLIAQYYVNLISGFCL